MVISFLTGLIVGLFAMHILDGQPVAQAALNTIFSPLKWVVGVVDGAWSNIKGLFSK